MQLNTQSKTSIRVRELGEHEGRCQRANNSNSRRMVNPEGCPCSSPSHDPVPTLTPLVSDQRQQSWHDNIANDTSIYSFLPTWVTASLVILPHKLKTVLLTHVPHWMMALATLQTLQPLKIFQKQMDVTSKHILSTWRRPREAWISLCSTRFTITYYFRKVTSKENQT